MSGGCASGLWPSDSTVQCSGHGVCVNSVCVCDSGWTGHNDIVGAPVQDCNINILAVAVLWILVLVPVTIHLCQDLLALFRYVLDDNSMHVLLIRLRILVRLALTRLILLHTPRY